MSRATHASYRVGEEVAGQKLTSWMKKNVCKDWRRIQKLYAEGRVWIIPEQTIQAPLDTSDSKRRARVRGDHVLSTNDVIFYPKRAVVNQIMEVDSHLTCAAETDSPVGLHKNAKIQWVQTRILHEDSDFIIFNKPGGVAWSATQGQKDASLLHLLRWYYDERAARTDRRGAKRSHNKQQSSERSDVILEPILRLPVEMSGITIIAKHAAALEMSLENIRGFSFCRQKYLAVVSHSLATRVSTSVAAFPRRTALLHASGKSAQSGVLRIPLRFEPSLSLLVPASPDDKSERVKTVVNF